MHRQKRNIGKWILLLILLAIIITAMVSVIKSRMHKEPEGTYIMREDAYLLYLYLYGGIDMLPDSQVSENNIIQQEETEIPYLTLHEATAMLSLLQERYPVYEGEIEAIAKEAFPNNRSEGSAVLAEEFLACYQAIWQKVQADSPLYEEEGILLGDTASVKNLDDSQTADNTILLAAEQEDGQISEVRLFQETALLADKRAKEDNAFYQKHCYLGTGEYLLLDLTPYRDMEMTPDFVLKACWIASNQPEKLWIILNDYQIAIQSDASGVYLEDGSLYDTFEDIADLYFREGALAYLETYKQKVSGKLLSVSDETIELEGAGFYPYEESLPVYKLYGQKEAYTKSDLKIGYDFTDFVLDEDGVIIAGLVTREEKMDSIRVVIKTTGFASAYHESITLTCDTDFLLNEEHHLAGEEVVISSDDSRFQNDRIYIRPETNLARTSISSIERDQGVPAYRGNFEIARKSEGLLLINELLLEEYLYSVVPSEMPASYPSEALKAQAISARTYAYQRMLHSGLKEYGAHVDDSAAFQVYNNIKESENTTLAIRDTQGLVAAIGNELAETYYYSTSCGFGTDIGAWHSGSEEQYTYLTAKHISNIEAQADEVAQNITDEENFRNYISTVWETDYESSEGWYRWKYDTTLNLDRLNENLLQRYEASAKSILVSDADNGFVSSKPPVFTQITRMAVVKRESGGVIDELLIEGREGAVKVVGEHAVRAVLANEGGKVIRQDGSESTVSSLLPSAFCVLDVQVDSDTNSIVAYTVTGGGYGHGIGMSQNAARAMADTGMTCENILQFFYEGISLTNMYELE